MVPGNIRAMEWLGYVVGIGVSLTTLRFFYRKMVEGSVDVFAAMADPMTRSMGVFFVGVAAAAGVLSFHGVMLVASWFVSP